MSKSEKSIIDAFVLKKHKSCFLSRYIEQNINQYNWFVIIFFLMET